jgi:phosphate transport system substrate-binding protein
MFALLTKRLARLTCVALIAGAVSGLSAAVASAAATLNGAGSTLVAPLEGEWATVWGNQTGNKVIYQAVGSGTGLKDIAAGVVDFGASDAPLSASTTVCNGCREIPWALSATAIGFNIPGVHRLHLTGPVIAKIYLGQITRWNDHAIAVLNKGTHLPNLKITPFHRLDGSGDTYAFADYESHVSTTFKHQIGTGVKLAWPTPNSATGNGGMVLALQGTPGAIAYVAVSYLLANQLPAAGIQNAAGNYEVPNFKNIANAAASVHSLPGNNEVHIVDPPKRQRIAYPISTFTYVIVPTNAPQGAVLKKFISWALTSGQAFGPRLGFVPIPSSVKNAGQSTLNGIH